MKSGRDLDVWAKNGPEIEIDLKAKPYRFPTS